MTQGMNPDETRAGAHSGKEPQIDRRSTAISCIDLFCGLGGLTHGLI
jgi:DNA (cytosine-5)-methyltransferase 1